MDSKDYHKMCEDVDDIVPSSSKDSVHDVEDIVLEETNGSLEDNKAAGINKTTMEIDAIETANEIKIETTVVQEQFVEPSADNKCDTVDKENIVEGNENKEAFRKTSFDTINSITSSEPTIDQNNIPTSSGDAEAGSVFTDQNKIKRSISKGQINSDSCISMKTFENSSDEDSSKRQKLNEGVSNKSKSEDEGVENTHQNLSKENGGCCNEGGTEDVEMGQGSEKDMIFTGTENSEPGVEVDYDSTEDTKDTVRIGDKEDTDDTEDTEDTKNTGDSEDTKDTEETDENSCLDKEKPKPNWFVVPELFRREMGNNPLFRRRCYGSLHVVEHFELMKKLEEHNGCVNALNFNQKGNLLASGSDDLAVVIWDWAIGKKRHVFDSGHKSNLFQTKWLPFDVEYLMATCARDGEVRLLDVRHGISRKIAMHHGPIHRLAVHADIPHVIISVGDDAEVLSIDIREEKPTRLLVVKDDSARVRLYSVHSNPLNSNEFCVAGQTHVVKVYDRRKASAPLYNLSPDHLRGANDEHITCAVYNYNGTEILASYRDEDIYLFDTVSPQPGDYAHKYQGHRNNATVKGVNFFGPKSEYIVSGSDCGNIFIWDKNTEAIVNWLHGDEKGVVNCLEPHPYVPILATSGLDYDVKIWVPSCEKPPSMKDLKSCVKFNTKQRTLDAMNFSNVSRRMVSIFIRSARAAYGRGMVSRGYSVQSSDDDNDNDDDDDDDWNDSVYSFFFGSHFN